MLGSSPSGLPIVADTNSLTDFAMRILSPADCSRPLGCCGRFSRDQGVATKMQEGRELGEWTRWRGSQWRTGGQADGWSDGRAVRWSGGQLVLSPRAK